MSLVPTDRPDATLRVALGEYDTGWGDPAASLDRASVCVTRGAANGARLIVLPEMCTTGFTMNPEKMAEGIDGPSFARLSTLAAVNDVWIMAGIAMRSDAGYTNVAAVFDPEGSLIATYAKQRLFSPSLEHERYIPGVVPVVIDMDGVRVSPFICYDLRFPEIFRSAAPWSDLIVVIANWPAPRRAHWDALLPARAIENLSYVIGVNRTGSADGLTYDGGSVAIDPWGMPVMVRVPGSPSVADISTARVSSIRRQYPFLDDLVQRAPE